MFDPEDNDLTLDTVYSTTQSPGGSSIHQSMEWRGFGPNSIYNDAFDFAQFEDEYQRYDPSPDDEIYGLGFVENADGSVTVIVEVTGFVDANGNRIPDEGFDPVTGTIDGPIWSAGTTIHLDTTLYSDEFYDAYDWLWDFIPFDDSFV